MKAKITPLSATLSEVDRKLVASAMQGQVAEARAYAAAPRPMTYEARKSRLKYATELRQLEKMLRGAAASMDRWRVGIEPEVEALSLRTAFEQRQMVAPDAVRSMMLRYHFLLVRLKARLTVRGGMPLKSVRMHIAFDPKSNQESRRSKVHALFPETEGRAFRGMHVIFALRPNLSFWVPRMPTGVAYSSLKDIESSVRRTLLLGPMKMAFRKLAIVGYGAGTSRAEWTLSAGRQAVRSARFETMIVLRVPRGLSRVTAETSLEAEALMPGLLAGTLGRRRLIRGTGHLVLPVARRPGGIPGRSD